MPDFLFSGWMLSPSVHLSLSWYFFGSFGFTEWNGATFAMAISFQSREICKLCWNENPIGFSVPDEVWEAVVPEHVRDRVVCLSCFTRIADAKRILWDRDIEFFPVSLLTHLESQSDSPGISPSSSLSLISTSSR